MNTGPSNRLRNTSGGESRKDQAIISGITDQVRRILPWRPSENGIKKPSKEDPPLRLELLNVEQLERHARELAGFHQLAMGPGNNQLLERLNENEAILFQTHELVRDAIERKRRIAPAAEWLLDNFYLIEEQIRTARRHLPPSYNRELPRLANSGAATFPRVYAIVLDLIAHVDGLVDNISLDAFLKAYQTVHPLKLGELWALPIMLRLALIENLRRVAIRIASSRRDRDLASDWAERMVLVVEQNPTNLILVMADMARANPDLSGPFLAEMTRHLQGQSPHFSFVNNWLTQRLSEQGLNIEQLVGADGQAQAADQVSMGNCITSLRFLVSNDWREFVERHSLVDQILSEDPVYGEMSFSTRDRYRHVVEKIARRSPSSEQDVARQAILFANRRAGERNWLDADVRPSHVGYYLIDQGRPELETKVGFRKSYWTHASSLVRRFPLVVYVNGVILLTAISTISILSLSNWWQVMAIIPFLLIIPLVMCATHLGIGFINWLAMLLVQPRSMPRMDFTAGIPPDNRTIVVVPTMLTNPEAIVALLEGLEVRFLANRDDHLHFALLTDFLDAGLEVMDQDAQLVQQARDGIEQLNSKYNQQRTNIFFLFHRPRRWNAQEKIWMGYERKRGKLAEFNALLCQPVRTDHSTMTGEELGRFSVIVGDLSVLAEIRYVITLDTDTQLPLESARQMVGAMAHPLNRPVFDEQRSRVVAGYGIMQPRIGVSLPSAKRSWFVRLFAGDAGVDPYTRVVSDLYQDLFDEGSFIGKGIYDVKTFELCCRNYPENAILSHDLLESTYVRSSLLSDVELYEEFPSRYLTDVSRRHRWIRGDWQIAYWLLPWVPAQNSSHVKNPIGVLSWWKIFDNMRRSLVPTAMILVLLISWVFLDIGSALGNSLFMLAVLGLVPLLGLWVDLFRKPSDLPWIMHFSGVGGSLFKQGTQFIGTLLFLPYEAFISTDAILRTLTRMLWSKTKMLEWKTSSDANTGADMGLVHTYRAMAIGPILSLSTGVLLLIWNPYMFLVAGPFLCLWLLSPWIAWWLSRALPAPSVQLSDSRQRFLRNLARRTWRFFEVFVTEEENWLPPDNIQEKPMERVASRTSPTNIGIALLSDLAAYDFGYCGCSQFLDRIGKTLNTLGRLERYRGHFYNWYNTRTLKPLYPMYVSTVDSGNLVGHLLVLRSGLLELIDAPIINPGQMEGLLDTAFVLEECALGLHRQEKDRHFPRVSQQLLEQIHQFMNHLRIHPQSIHDSFISLQHLTILAKNISSRISNDPETQWWACALDRSCADHYQDLLGVAGWLMLPEPPRQLSQLKAFSDIMARLKTVTGLRGVADMEKSILPLLESLLLTVGAPETIYIAQLKQAIFLSSQQAAARILLIKQLVSQSYDFAAMDFSFLLESTRDLFAIGYNVGDQRLDNSYYDLLASEARLASYVLIAQGQVKPEHWFILGRMLTSTGGATALLSWSGSMFEYLMPILVMPNYENTLLDQTYKAVVQRQIEYGKQRGVPWGISESGYNTIDAQLNYQYRAFGVPGLGLKRGLAEDLVIAPYACVLALMVRPEAACVNLQRLASQGHAGPYGFYEAIDFTPSRLPVGMTNINVRQYMSHHQGMSLLALAFYLLDQPMQRRFNADPMLRSANLLLQERVPNSVAPIFPHISEANTIRITSAEEEGATRVFTSAGGSVPEIQLLSNGHYHVVITNAGGGYSRCGDLAVTRWREDVTRDCYGSFCYLRDLDSGVLWSSAWQPTLKSAKRYRAIFTHSRAEFARSDDRIDTSTEISVSPEDDIELRRITIKNRSKYPRTIELTSYAEVVLALPAHDLSHPAFSNLFVQTEIVGDRQAILCTRRPRSNEEKPPWMIHLMTILGTAVGPISFETDRMRFIGRGRTLANPRAMEGNQPLSGSHGPVLDPVICIRNVVTLQTGESIRINLVTGVAATRETAVGLIDKYSDPRIAERVFELAWTHNQVLLRQVNASETDAQDYSRLAGAIIYASAFRRAKASVLIRNRRGQSGLWGYGISGDLPIVLVRIRDQLRIDLVRQVLRAHAYWRMKGLIVDLVIWNEDDSVYRQTLQDTIMDLVAGSPKADLVDKPGGIFVRRGEQISEEDRALLQTVARIILVDDAGTLHEQSERRGRSDLSIPQLIPTRNRVDSADSNIPKRDLAFVNDYGGFSRDGREYVVLHEPDRATPAPWVNVIANSHFGTVISESGSAYTWSENSHEFRLTPWYNDPVTDVCGEALYLRDEETGIFWSPSPLPARGRNPYVARHGFGYSMFESNQEGMITELSVYVATDAPVKFQRLKITNRSGRRCNLSVSAFSELVLGEIRDKSLMHIVTEIDPKCGAFFARNPYSPEFTDRIVFIDCSELTRGVTGNRTEFIGRNGTLANPAAMGSVRLSGRVGAGFDPCAAIQVFLNLEEGQEKEVVFILGCAPSEEQARELVQRFRGTANAYRALEGVWHYWSRTLGAVHVETPDPSINFLVNGWLVYQTMSCRLWARTGFYQSGGAFGFRDQLQDAMALVHVEPNLLREQLLRAAGRQFREGDVQHWWHPPAGRGVRTHFSDDYLWLPYATCRYVSSVGDTGVLQELIPFLNSRLLRPDEEANYDLPQISNDAGTLYDHCIRAIDHGLTFGVHGLPLMGCGDWNDGMNLVGQHGKGESVWLAFFLHDVLKEFIEIARKCSDTKIVDRYTAEAMRLKSNIEQHGWDGEWYRRAYFDDGTPLGSASNPECQIDSISQSWAVLSGVGSRERVLQAMDNLDRRLVHRDTQLIQLLDPPFDQSNLNPGYIKGYVPGVRENGGQYTHGAIWTVMAFAAMGDSRRAWELFGMINPINHSNTLESITKYRVEPYVIAADVYAVQPHTGRGGWTWYTGSAGWMYRLITESLLGLRLEVDQLRFEPTLNSEWKEWKIHYRYRDTFYHITFRNEQSDRGKVRTVILDDQILAVCYLTLRDDRSEHRVVVEIS